MEPDNSTAFLLTMWAEMSAQIGQLMQMITADAISHEQDPHAWDRLITIYDAMCDNKPYRFAVYLPSQHEGKQIRLQTTVDRVDIKEED